MLIYFTLERVLVECFYTFIMASETNLTDVERAINQLQGVLNENYLAAEKIMALRTPNTSELKAILAKIDKSYDELVGAMASARKDTEAIVAVTQNQHEFNLRKKEWFSTLDNPSSSTAAVPEPSTIAPRPSSFVSPSSSRHSSRSSRSSSKLSSSSSSRISAKHLEATAKLKIAQLKLVHIEERANEEAQRLRLRANEEAQRLRLKKEIEQREADREIALARVEYEIYNEFAAETTRLSDDVTTILSSDNENTVETVVPKTCSELTFARSSSLLSNNLSGSNTLSLGGLPPAKSTMCTGPVLGVPPIQSSMSTGPVLDLLPVQSSMSTGPVLDLLPVQSFMSTGPVLGLPPVQSSMSTGPVLGLLPVQSSMSTGPVLGLPLVQSTMSTGPVLGVPPIQSSMSTGPVLGVPPIQSSMSTGPVLGLPPVQSSMSTGLVLGLPPVQSSMSTGPVLGLPPVQSSMSTGPVLGVPPIQSSMSAGPVLGLPPVQSSMSTGPVLGLPPIQSSSSTCQVWSSSYVHGPLPAHPDISAGSSHMQVAPSVAHSYNFNRLPASNPLGPPPSSADLPIYSHVSPLLYPGVYNQNSVNYDSLFLPRPEFPKFSGDPLEYKAFMNNFETHIEPRVRDEKTLICLLLQHCSKDVKDRIEHFATSEVQPYTVAKQRLNKEYGSPWVISDACEQRLKKFPSVRSGDGKQLRRFAELLEKTGVIVKDIRQYTSLDSLDMLTELVNKLPYDLKRRWVSKSVQIQNYLGHLANFLHFVDFVRKESDEVNSLFGLRSLHPKTTSTKTKASSFGSVMSKTSANVNSKSSISGSRHVTQVGSCWYCKNTSHILFDCKDFKQIPVEDRISFVKESKLCHKCLSSKHKTRECKRSKLCSVTGCKGLYHHTLLHKFATTKEHPPKTSSEDKAVVPVTCGFTKSESCSNSDNSHVYLCIVPVRVSFGENVVSTYAFLDQGSTHSFCKRSLLQELKASGTRERLQLKTITGTTNDMDSVSCNLVVSDLDSDSSFSLSNVHSVENIPVQPNNVSVDAEVCKLPHLQDINLKSLPHASVNLLIGADVPELFCIYSARRGPRGTPCAIETPLGWSLLGPSLSPSQGSNCTVNFIVKKDATEMVARMWETEFEPGTSIFDDSFSKEDRLAHTLMQSEICTIDGHYQLPLLWKEPYKNQLPNNLPLAQRRLTSLKVRLQRDDNLRVKYAEVVESYLSKGYAREVQQAYLTESNDPIWYLPHHPVTNVHKPEKVRVVFDCAAKYHGLSLNDTLMKGPTFMNNLVGVLIRFRKNKIALVADVEAMFHQVRVEPSHTNALRFLWWKDGDLNNEPIVCQMLVHLFGATSSPSCANFSLRQTAIEFGHLYKPVISSIINNNFYVDDCLVSLPSVEDAIYVYNSLTSILARRGFHLTKWIANHEEVLNEISESERSKRAQQYLVGGPTDDRVLGIQWNVNDDQFTFDVKLTHKPSTRRGILSTVASLYDPLGFVAPVLLKAKRLLQVLCKQNLGWDDPIGEPKLEQWKDWIEALHDLNAVKVPRCFKPSEFGKVVSVQIHHFADASSYGYGTCSYLRLEDEFGSVCLSFIIGKSRLAPVKSVSIPRLELTAAVLAVRLDVLVRKEIDLPVGSSYFWIDSTAVLYCIKNSTKRFPVFVANRLAIIENHTSVEQWHHVPSKQNPADIASRGVEASKLFSENWLKGPPFLSQPHSEWPDSEQTVDEPPSEFLGAKTHIIQATIKVDRELDAIDKLTSHCSSLYKLKRKTAWLWRFITFLQQRRFGKPLYCNEPLSVQELQIAE